MSRMIDDEETLKDNGLIEIDGCNVAECKYFLFRDKEEIPERSCGVGLVNCKGQDCMFKQLQRAKAENEKLKDKAYKDADMIYQLTEENTEYDIDLSIEKEAHKSTIERLDKYHQALEEIRKYCNECNLKADDTACEILAIIDEVLNNVE